MMKIVTIAVTGIVSAAVIGLAFNAGFSANNKNTKQTASARLNHEGVVVDTTVDVSDGYSCDFAKGAVYLYDDASKDDSNLVAIAMTLDKDVYDEYAVTAFSDSNRQKVNDGVVFNDEGQTGYICPVGDSAYFAIFSETATRDEMVEIANRFTVAPEALPA